MVASGPGFAFTDRRGFSPDEVTVRHGIPVTTVARTLLDLADVLDGQALKRIITEAEYLNRFDMTAINAAVQNNPGRRGARLMEAAGARRHRTRSPLEQRFLRLLERHRVEEPESGVWIEGYEADFVWREPAWSSSSTALPRTARAPRSMPIDCATADSGGQGYARCG